MFWDKKSKKPNNFAIIAYKFTIDLVVLITGIDVINGYNDQGQHAADGRWIRICLCQDSKAKSIWWKSSC